MLSKEEFERRWANTRRPPRPSGKKRGTVPLPLPKFTQAEEDKSTAEEPDGKRGGSAEVEGTSASPPGSEDPFADSDFEISFLREGEADPEPYVEPNQLYRQSGPLSPRISTPGSVAGENLDDSMNGESDPRPPGNSTGLDLETMSQLLDKKLEGVAKTTDVNRAISELSDRVRENTESISMLWDRLERLEKRSTTITSGTVGGESRAFRAGARSAKQEEIRLNEFDKARRTLRIWPIDGESADQIELCLREFLENALDMTTDEVEDLRIESTERVKSARNGLAYDEVAVVFETPERRDELSQRARLLAPYRDGDGRPTAGFRMQVPSFLETNFKLLEELGFRLRREHGIGLRRYIKFDETVHDLYLEVKMPESRKWHRIAPAIAREMRDRQNRDEISEIMGGPVRSGAPVSTNRIPLGRKRPREKDTSTTPQIQPQPRVDEEGEAALNPQGRADSLERRMDSFPTDRREAGKTGMPQGAGSRGPRLNGEDPHQIDVWRKRKERNPAKSWWLSMPRMDSRGHAGQRDTQPEETPASTNHGKQWIPKPRRF